MVQETCQNISTERSYVTIDLDNFNHNIQAIYHWTEQSGRKEPVQIIAVIKTDGYGHGAVRLARELEQYPYIWGYAVATAGEAMELRNAGMKKRILILGYSFPSAYEDLVRYQITPAVFDMESAIGLAKEAEHQNVVLPIHIKIDTGMSRVGILPSEEGIELIKEIAALPSLSVEGIFTHLSRADEWDQSFSLQQIRRFNEINEALKKQGIHIPLRHCANSAGIMELEAECKLELMRAGIIIYGLMPSEEVHQEYISLKPILEWKSTVIYVKKLPAGVPVSYGGTYITSRDTVVATIPTGYGDGYPRLLSNTGEVLIHGQRAPIIGRVCMDQFMVDVTGIEGVCRGDSVTLIGRDGTEEIRMDELAAKCGTINYEIACNINKRIPRRYLKQ